MNPYQVMMQKTGVKVVGLVKSLNEFVPPEDKTKIYYSMDLDIEGQKIPLTVSIPLDADRSKFQVGELAEVRLSVSSFNGKTRFLVKV